jgi:co-chaperonin GroES (HSP10)
MSDEMMPPLFDPGGWEEGESRVTYNAFEPGLWRVWVQPMTPKKYSKGGIEIPTQAQDAQVHLNYIGRILRAGPLAGKSERFVDAETKRSTWSYKEGDFIVYGRYAGQPMEVCGVRTLVVNDDEILGRLPNPDDIKVYV